MNIPEEKLLRLLDELHQRHQAGSTKWKEQVQDLSFSLSLPRSGVILTSRDGDGLPPFVIELLDAEGVVSERYVTDESDPLNHAVGVLFASVRRATSTAGAAIDAVLQDLQDDDIPF